MTQVVTRRAIGCRYHTNSLINQYVHQCVDRGSETCVSIATVVPMITHDVLELLRQEWSDISRSSESRHAWNLVVERHSLPFLSNEVDFSGVLLRLEPRQGLSVEQRSFVIQVLLMEAREKFVHRALLQTLLPGVVSTCRQLKFGRGIIERPSDVLSEAIAMLSDLIGEWAGQSRQYAAPDLLSALRGRLRRWLLKEKEVRRRIASDVPETAVSPAVSTLSARLEILGRHVEHRRLVRLTWLRVFANQPLHALADEEGVSVRHLQSELQEFARQHLL